MHPEKLAGFCGKIMCCLAFENDDYEKVQALLPAVGASVNTPDGVGTVFETSNIKETVTVEFKDESLIRIRTYPLSEILTVDANKQQNHKNESIQNSTDDISTPIEDKSESTPNKEPEHKSDNKKKGNFFKHKKKKWNKPPVKQ